jgi:hypothetical protein
MARGRKKNRKTGQQSKGGGDDNVGLDVPKHNETNCGNCNDDVLDENRNNEGGNDVCDDANNVCKSCDGDNGDGDNSDGIANNIGGNDSNDGPNHNETNSGDGNYNVLGGNRKKEEGKDFCDDNIVVGKTCDGDNGDGDNSDGIVKKFGGIVSNDVLNPPDSGDTVGEVNSVSDANDVGKSCDGDNGDCDNSDGIVNNIGGNDSYDAGNPLDSDETLSVKEKRKGKQYSNLREEVTTIVDLMDLTIMKLTAVMTMMMFLVETEKRKRQRCWQ